MRETRVGPFRLFDLSGRRLKCRVCGARIRADNQGRHMKTEIKRHGETGLRTILRLRLKTRRSLKRRDYARYVFATTKENEPHG